MASEKKIDWNQKEIDDLIMSVRKRRVLWDRNHPQHHNHYALNVQWTRIAQEIGIDQNQGRQKWKSLRDTYRKESAKVQSSRALKDNILYQPTWPQYEKLHFLKEQFKFVPTSEETTVEETRHTPSSNGETRSLSDIDGEGGSSLENQKTGIKRKETLSTEIDQNQIAKKPCPSIKIHHDYCHRGSQTEILSNPIEELKGLLTKDGQLSRISILISQLIEEIKELPKIKGLLEIIVNQFDRNEKAKRLHEIFNTRKTETNYLPIVPKSSQNDFFGQSSVNNLSQNPDLSSSQSLLSVFKEKQPISMHN